MLKILSFTIILLLLTITESAGAGGGKGGGDKAEKGAKGKDSKVADAPTSHLCDWDPSKAVDRDSSKFDGKCASCISRSMQTGKQCYLNTWTRVTDCECTNFAFENCKCIRTFSMLTYFIVLICPAICGAMILIARQCMKNSNCPLYTLEKDYKKWVKKKKARQAKEEKEAREGDDEFGSSLEEDESNEHTKESHSRNKSSTASSSL